MPRKSPFPSRTPRRRLQIQILWSCHFPAFPNPTLCLPFYPVRDGRVRCTVSVWVRLWARGTAADRRSKRFQKYFSTISPPPAKVNGTFFPRFILRRTGKHGAALWTCRICANPATAAGLACLPGRPLKPGTRTRWWGNPSPHFEKRNIRSYVNKYASKSWGFLSPTTGARRCRRPTASAEAITSVLKKSCLSGNVQAYLASLWQNRRFIEIRAAVFVENDG